MASFMKFLLCWSTFVFALVLANNDNPFDCTIPEQFDQNVALYDKRDPRHCDYKYNKKRLIKCPVLNCEEDVPFRKVGDVCYQHDGVQPSLQMKGGLCFDIKQAPITENPLFCPFSLDGNEEYAWVNEYLQQQDSGDPERPRKLS